MKPSTLLRLYPRAWRARYGEEFLALVERGVDRRARLDIVRSALRERIIVHGRMPMILALVLTVFPGSLLVAALGSSVATLVASQLHSVFGPLALPTFAVRIQALALGLVILVLSFRDATRTRTLTTLVCLAMVSSVLMKWMSQTWLHPLSAQDFEAWTAYGRGDFMWFATILLTLSMRVMDVPLSKVIAAAQKESAR